jgi:4-hydroxybenzoate polyprenyltransferase
MSSNITFMDSSNTLLDIFAGVNAQIPSFSLIILGALSIIIFMMFQNYEIKKILLFEGFILTIVGLLMVTMGWLAMMYIMIPVILLIFAIFFNLKG